MRILHIFSMKLNEFDTLHNFFEISRFSKRNFTLLINELKINFAINCKYNKLNNYKTHHSDHSVKLLSKLNVFNKEILIYNLLINIFRYKALILCRAIICEVFEQFFSFSTFCSYLFAYINL